MVSPSYSTLEELNDEWTAACETYRNAALTVALLPAGVTRGMPSHHLGTTAGYLNAGAALARRSAGGDVDWAQMVGTQLHATPATSESRILLIRALDRFGEREHADRLYADSEASLRAHLDANPMDHSARSDMVWLSARTGRNLDEALEMASQACAAAPEWSRAWEAAAEVHYARGEYSRAAELQGMAALVLSQGFSFTGRSSNPFHVAQFARFKKALAEQQERAEEGE